MILFLAFSPKKVSQKYKQIINADGVILPGVGSFRYAIEEIKKLDLNNIFPNLNKDDLQSLVKSTVLSTQYSPTINLNKIFSLIPSDIKLQKEIQLIISRIMDKVLESSKEEGLENSFYLHVAPNLGKEDDKEIVKPATHRDVGTTDIQFMLTGAIKEAGLIVLINKYIQRRFGKAPLGEDFNLRNAPREIKDLQSLCVNNFSKDEIPLLIGIGDTVTSNRCANDKNWLRGGSDWGPLSQTPKKHKGIKIK